MANIRYVKHYKQLYLIQKTDLVNVDIEGDYNCFNDKLNINFGVKDLLNSRGKNRQVFKMVILNTIQTSIFFQESSLLA